MQSYSYSRTSPCANTPHFCCCCWHDPTHRNCSNHKQAQPRAARLPSELGWFRCPTAFTVYKLRMGALSEQKLMCSELLLMNCCCSNFLSNFKVDFPITRWVILLILFILSTDKWKDPADIELGILPFYDSICYHNCLLFCFVSAKLMDYNNYFACCISLSVLGSGKAFGPGFFKSEPKQGYAIFV